MLSESDVEDGLVEQHIDFLQRRKICVMYCLDNDGGVIELIRGDDADGTPVTLPVAKNRVVLFRHDIMTYAYRPRGHDLALQAWLLEAPAAMELDKLRGSQESVQNLIGGPELPAHRQGHIMAAGCRFPGRVEDGWQFFRMLSTCTDCYLQVPLLRFDIEEFYSPERQPGKTVAKHCGVCDDKYWQSFDNEFFGISHVEAFVLPPMQRVCLETIIEMMNRAGYTLKDLRGKPFATIIAEIGVDQEYFRDFRFQEAWINGSWVHNISTGNRLAYHTGLVGPSAQVDTACSASLVSFNLGFAYLRNPNSGVQGVVMHGVQQIMSVGPFLGLSAAGMTGASGRCLTFDQSANGFARGEGPGGTFCKAIEKSEDIENRLGAHVGGFINQDGRSASLTAPNGPSQQAAVRGSMADAQIDYTYATFTENHGTGTALGDPIEVGSIRAVFEKRVMPLPIMSGKTHTAHLEPGAGSIGILKTLFSMLNATVPPNCHLRQANAHLDIDGFPGVLPIEDAPTNKEHGYAGVNGFGFGGTNSRCDMWVRCRNGTLNTDWRAGMCAPPPGKQFEFEKLNIMTSVCPRCSGDMCWLCGMSVPKTGTESKHHCSTIRAEFASYAYCTDCYEGRYQYGQQSLQGITDGSNLGKVCIVGSWTAWSTFDPMVRNDDGTYECYVVLGDTLMEEFHFVVGKDRYKPIHPTTPRASPHTRIVGPDGNEEEYHWLIDGRQDDVKAGAVYRIVFTWGDGQRSVNWSPVAPPPQSEAIIGQGYKHSYSLLLGKSMTQAETKAHPDVDARFHFREMGQHYMDRNLWITKKHIGEGGQLKFAFVRDRDREQTLYPGEEATSDTNGPIIVGTSLEAAGRMWTIEGNEGESVKIQLRIADGEIVVVATTRSRGEQVWRSCQRNQKDTYYVTGTLNGWTLSEMECIENTPGILRHRFTLGKGGEWAGKAEFQIIVNEDWQQRLHPDRPRQRPGAGSTCGPNGDGHGLNWKVVGRPGEKMEIKLNMQSKDLAVSCGPCRN